MTKYEILTDAATQREQEILEYQINIDNYVLAIELAKEDPDLTSFVIHLKDLLSSSILEQKKAKIIYQVVVNQLKEM